MPFKDRKKILIIDDEEELVEMMVLKLDWAGFDVRAAYNGSNGLEMVGTTKPDLILLDVVMPGLNGWEVCKRIKQNPQTKNLPVIILTAAKGRDTDDKAAESGADGVLIKPFDDKALMAAIHELLGSPQQS